MGCCEDKTIYTKFDLELFDIQIDSDTNTLIIYPLSSEKFDKILSKTLNSYLMESKLFLNLKQKDKNFLFDNSNSIFYCYVGSSSIVKYHSQVKDVEPFGVDQLWKVSILLTSNYDKLNLPKIYLINETKFIRDLSNIEIDLEKLKSDSYLFSPNLTSDGLRLTKPQLTIIKNNTQNNENNDSQDGIDAKKRTQRNSEGSGDESAEESEESENNEEKSLIKNNKNYIHLVGEINEDKLKLLQTKLENEMDEIGRGSDRNNSNRGPIPLKIGGVRGRGNSEERTFDGDVNSYNKINGNYSYNNNSNVNIFNGRKKKKGLSVVEEKFESSKDSDQQFSVIDPPKEEPKRLNLASRNESKEEEKDDNKKESNEMSENNKKDSNDNDLIDNKNLNNDNINNINKNSNKENLIKKENIEEEETNKIISIFIEDVQIPDIDCFSEIIDTLIQYPFLKRFSFCDTVIEKDSQVWDLLLKLITENNNIRWIDLHRSNIDNYMLESLCSALEIKRIRYLDLSENFIGEEGVKSLITFLSQNKTLQRLILNNNDLDEFKSNGVNLICDSLLNHPNIQMIDFSSMIITGSGAKIAELIKNSKTLSSVNLRDCNLNLKDFQNICRAIKICKNQNLVNVDLSFNCLASDKSIEEIGEMVKVNKSLTFLNMDKMNINMNNYKFILDGLKLNDTITKFSFCYNPLIKPRIILEYFLQREKLESLSYIPYKNTINEGEKKVDFNFDEKKIIERFKKTRKKIKLTTKEKNKN